MARRLVVPDAVVAAPAPPAAEALGGSAGLFAALIVLGALLGLAGWLASGLDHRRAVPVPVYGPVAPSPLSGSFHWLLWLAALAAVAAALLAMLPGPTAGAFDAAQGPVRLASRAASVITVGFLCTAALMTADMWQRHGTARRLWDFGGGAASGWLAASAALLVLAYIAQDGEPSAAGFGIFALSAEGSPLLAEVVLVVVVAVSASRVRRRSGALGVVPLAVYAVAAATLAGEASARPLWAQVSLGAHVVGAAVWVGSLMALGVVARRARRADDEKLPAVSEPLYAELRLLMPDFSRLMQACAVTVALSGLLMGLAAVGSMDELRSSLGIKLLAKGALTVLALVVARQHHTRSLPALASGDPGRRELAVIAVRELVLLVVITVLALGLQPVA